MNVDRLFIALGKNLDDVKPLSGGDINRVYQLGESVFKVNEASSYPEMLKKEAHGLELLSGAIKVPRVIEVGEKEGLQYLQMEWIERGEENDPFWEKFGRDLAHLHQHTNDLFGLEESNYIGSLQQSNGQCENWPLFLIEQRLQPMIEMAVNGGEVNYVEAKAIEGFYDKVQEIYPNEPPALIHGDLWSGNYLCDTEGNPVLIDPAAYYGHREMDIGMMHLFGGFNEKLFDAYQEVNPLDGDWRSRIRYNQIYPLLVHVNIFGRSYWSQVQHILEAFRKFLP